VASDAWLEAFKMQENAIWRLQNERNQWGGRRWGSLQRFPRSSSWWGGAAWMLSPKNLILALGFSGLACPRPQIFKPPPK